MEEQRAQLEVAKIELKRAKNELKQTELELDYRQQHLRVSNEAEAKCELEFETSGGYCQQFLDINAQLEHEVDELNAR